MLSEMIWKSLSDPVEIINLLIMFFSGWGFLLFSYWWIKVKKASPVFKYMTIYLFASIIRNAVETRERAWYLYYNQTHSPQYSTALWEYRSLLVLIAVAALVIHMTVRFLKNKGGSDS